MEGLDRPLTSLGDLFSAVPLVLEVDDFRVPVIDLVWYGIKGHDLLHKQGGDSSGKEADKNVMVSDAGMSGVTLEGQDVTLK